MQNTQWHVCEAGTGNVKSLSQRLAAIVYQKCYYKTRHLWPYYIGDILVFNMFMSHDNLHIIYCVNVFVQKQLPSDIF